MLIAVSMYSELDLLTFWNSYWVCWSVSKGFWSCPFGVCRSVGLLLVICDTLQITNLNSYL